MSLPKLGALRIVCNRPAKRRGVICALSVAAALGSFAGTVTAKDFLDVRARDQCDPATFGALCTGSHTGSVTLDAFRAALATGGHDAWKFNPGPSGAHIDRGGVVQVRSEAGETHTFTQVAQFGGGFIPALNVAVGNAAPAPECLLPRPSPTSINVTADSSVLFQAGNSALFPPGIHLYQCCIHPWMRTIITVR